MKILYCIDHLRPDGTQRVLAQLTRGLAARGHQQAVLCLNDSWDDEVVSQLRRVGVEMRIMGKQALIAGYGVLSAWLWLRHRRFDVAVTLLFAADAIGRPLAKSAGIGRIVSSIRARNTNYTTWQYGFVRATMPLADKVIINSATMRDFVVAMEGAPPDKIIHIPNGIDVEQYRYPINREQLCAEFNISPEQRIVGSIGRLTYQKGFDLLLHAFASLPGKDATLILIGTGEEEASLRAQATALHIAERVRFGGYRRDVFRLLGRLDLYVHPARFEGMPNALLEAMAAGCPIVATAVDGNCDLIEDGVHGWLAPSENAEALALALGAALGDQAEARRRASAAQIRAATQFSITAMVETWEQVLINQTTPTLADQEALN